MKTDKTIWQIYKKFPDDFDIILNTEEKTRLCELMQENGECIE